MKILIVTTPIGSEPTEFPPIGSLAVINAARKDGFTDTAFYNIDSQRPPYEDVLRRIESERPDVLGISAVVSTAYEYTKKLSLDVRRMFPDCLIVVGGNLASSAEIILRRTGTDLCVLGEGEETFVEVLRRARSTGRASDFSDVAGLVLLGAADEVVNTGYRPQLPGDKIYDVDWTELEKSGDLDLYIEPAFGPNGPLSWCMQDERTFQPHRRNKRHATVPVGKGCVARCTFCHRWDKGIRHSPVDGIIAELEWLIERYDVGFLSLSIETFGADKRWLAEFIERIKPMDLLWRAGGVRTNTLNVEWIARLKDAGCTSIIYGSETGSERMLKIMEKKVKLQDNVDAIKWTVDENLYTVIQLVIGMPGETPETIDETIEYLKTVLTFSPTQRPNQTSINYAQALPGTPLYEFARHRGLIGRELDDEEQYLITISDTDAHDEVNTLNHTDLPFLEVMSWRPRMTIELNYHYVKTFGLEHYRRHLLEDFAQLRPDRRDDRYFANPQRLVAVRKELDGAESAGQPQVTLPPLLHLMKSKQFGLAIVCYPEFFHRLVWAMPALTALNLLRKRGVGFTARQVWEYVRFKLLHGAAVKGFKFEYQSLRQIVDKELGALPGDAPGMTPLRKGR